MKFAQLLMLALLTALCAAPAAAQTISYADAIDMLGISCGSDIDKLCKDANLGGGRVQQCLDRNQAKVSQTCKTTIVNVQQSIQKRTAARASVLKTCDADIRKLCAGMKAEDGNLLSCFFKVRKNTSVQCQRAVADAGYDQ